MIVSVFLYFAINLKVSLIVSQVVHMNIQEERLATNNYLQDIPLGNKTRKTC